MIIFCLAWRQKVHPVPRSTTPVRSSTAKSAAQKFSPKKRWLQDISKIEQIDANLAVAKVPKLTEIHLDVSDSNRNIDFPSSKKPLLQKPKEILVPEKTQECKVHEFKCTILRRSQDLRKWENISQNGTLTISEDFYEFVCNNNPLQVRFKKILN